MKKQRINMMYLMIGACIGGLYTAGYGLANCLGLFYRSLAAAIGGGIGAVSLCATISLVVTGFTSKLMPTLLKKVPFKAIIAVGALLLAGGIAASTVAASLPFLIGCFVIKGVGGCLIGMTTINFLVDNWFHKGNGTVLGIAMSTSGLFAAVLSPCFSSLIENSGWQFSMAVLAAVSILLCLPAMFSASPYPNEKGMEPFGGSKPERQTAVGKKCADTTSFEKDFTYYTVIVISFLITAVFSMATHVATYASSINLTPATGALLVSTTMIGNMFFKLMIGVFSDKINPLRTSIITFSFVTLSFLLFIVGSQVTWINFVAAACFGATFGSYTVAIGQIIKMLFPREYFFQIYSSTLMISSVASAVFGPLLGYSYDWFHTYIPALSVFFVISLISVILLVILNKRQKK